MAVGRPCMADTADTRPSAPAALQAVVMGDRSRIWYLFGQTSQQRARDRRGRLRPDGGGQGGHTTPGPSRDRPGRATPGPSTVHPQRRHLRHDRRRQPGRVHLRHHLSTRTEPAPRPHRRRPRQHPGHLPAIAVLDLARAASPTTQPASPSASSKRHRPSTSGCPSSSPAPAHHVPTSRTVPGLLPPPGMVGRRVRAHSAGVLGLQADVPGRTLTVSSTPPSRFRSLDITGLSLAGQPLDVSVDDQGRVHATTTADVRMTAGSARRRASPSPDASSRNLRVIR